MKKQVLLILLFCQFGMATCPPLSPFSFKTLRKAIEDHPSLLNTVEKVLACFPKTHLQNWTLFFKSQSTQDATYADPRALLFGEDGRLIIGFNGKKDQQGFRRLETMEFDEKSRKFVLREIIFEDKKNPRFSKDNPDRCTVCHGSNPRPIFEEYNQWPGAYGEDNDKLRSEKKPGELLSELEQYMAFWDRAPTHPRYQFLRQIEDRDYSPYGLDGLDIYYQARTNLRFMDYLLRYHAERLLGMFLGEAELFEKYKYYLTFRVDSCAYKHLGDSAYTRIEQRLQRDLLARGLNFQTIGYHHYPYEIPAHLLALFKVGQDDWSLAFEPKGFEYETGQGDFRNIVAGALYRQLGRQDPEMAPFSQWDLQAETYLYGGDHTKNPRLLLHKRILESLDLIGGFPSNASYQDRCKVLGQKLQSF